MDDSRTVFCGNISDKVTEELLFELFLQAAPLERVRIPTDKEGRKSNFAFVTFKHEESVTYAQHLLNGIRMYDKCIQIKPRHNSANRLPEKSDILSRLGSAPLHNQFQSRQDTRESYSSRGQFRDHYRDESPRNYREDNQRDKPYNRHDSERNERYDSNRRRQNYNDRRGNFNDRRQRNRNNYY
ncbi:unnamed protein product [Psylliodes chrysocephalus]|uniref:RRM domain-containing protein n=1 Tax=Psylliodes chrysocephalus TaxID=3402493 RepID=A0A9P0D194_9CUCU|nr:unnamed protein product [Psylliodes chrysocephala]